MRNFSTQCIILGTRNLGESDKSVSLYNDQLGKIKAIAKGARKITSKFTGHLELLNFCEVSLYMSPKNIIIRELTALNPNLKKKEDLETLSAKLMIAEISNKMLFENQSMENLSALIKKTLEHLKVSQKPDLIAIAYIIKFLDKVGVIPDFKEIKFSLPEKYLKFFEFIKSKHLSEIEKIALSESEKFQIKKLLKKIIENETEISFRSLDL